MHFPPQVSFGAAWCRAVTTLVAFLLCAAVHAAGPVQKRQSVLEQKSVLARQAVLDGKSVLERKSVLDGKVSLLLPSNFVPMSQDLLARKYPTADRPALVYTNPQTTINVAFSHTPYPVSFENLPKAYEQISGGFRGQFPTGKWFASGMRKIGGRQCFLIDMRVPAADTDIRNLIVGTSLDDRLMLVSFNVTAGLETQWLETGNKIIDSIVVK